MGIWGAQNTILIKMAKFGRDGLGNLDQLICLVGASGGARFEGYKELKKAD
jgi:hypothetical protein